MTTLKLDAETLARVREDARRGVPVRFEAAGSAATFTLSAAPPPAGSGRPNPATGTFVGDEDALFGETAEETLRRTEGARFIPSEEAMGMFRQALRDRPDRADA